MSELKLRIPYADVDQMGFVYYANYLVYFERARTEFLREYGLIYKEIEAKGIYLPVSESFCKYITPAHYDDVITIRTNLSNIGFASIEFEYEVFCEQKTIMTGRTKHPFVNSKFRPTKIPEEFKKIMEKENGKKNCCCRR